MRPALSLAPSVRRPDVSEASPVSDADLLVRVSQGDVSALGALYDRHGAAVRRVLARLGVEAADVDDLAQETFLEVVRCAGAFDGRESARPWLLGLAVHRARRRRRSIATLVRHVTAWAREPAPEPPTPEDDARGAQAAEQARRALAGLSEKKREVFTLVVLEGLPGEQVARLLGIPLATVWTRLHHARRDLRGALDLPEDP